MPGHVPSRAEPSRANWQNELFGTPLPRLVVRLQAALHLPLQLDLVGVTRPARGSDTERNLFTLTLMDGSDVLASHPTTQPNLRLTEDELIAELRAALSALVLRQRYVEQKVVDFLDDRDWLADDPGDWAVQRTLLDTLRNPI